MSVDISRIRLSIQKAKELLKEIDNGHDYPESREMLADLAEIVLKYGDWEVEQ